jgi:hypothetical protein
MRASTSVSQARGSTSFSFAEHPLQAEPLREL